MIFIGDCHGLFQIHTGLCRRADKAGKHTCQLGDYGLGFAWDPDPAPGILPNSDRHKFMRGNHDNPQVCHTYPSCLPVFGYCPEIELFWLSGGFSIDYEDRIEGRDWWPDEEISYADLRDLVLPFYADCKPRIVASHECPQTAIVELQMSPHKVDIRNRTKEAMEQMWKDIHQPEIWVFGHHHTKRDKVIGKTRFVACGMLMENMSFDFLTKHATFEIEGMEWPNEFALQTRRREDL